MDNRQIHELIERAFKKDERGTIIPQEFRDMLKERFDNGSAVTQLAMRKALSIAVYGEN